MKLFLFFLGLSLGACLGLFFAALAFAAKRNDDPLPEPLPQQARKAGAL